MARSTGPILAMGGITLANASIVHGKPVDWRIPIATGILVGVAALAEKGAPDLVAGVAWLALLSSFLVPILPGVPTPAESLIAYWQAGGTATKTTA
jgi:hypothetical protein